MRSNNEQQNCISIAKAKFIENLMKVYCSVCQNKYSYTKFDSLCCCYYLKHSTTHNIMNETCCYVCKTIEIFPTDYHIIGNIKCLCIDCKRQVKIHFNNEYRHSIFTVHDYARSLENN